MARRTTPRRRFKEAVDELRREVGRPGGSNAPGPPSTGARVLVHYAREERRRPGCRRAAWAFEIRRHFFNSLLRLRGLPLKLLQHCPLALGLLWREDLRWKVRRLEHLANLDLAVLEGDARGPLDRLFDFTWISQYPAISSLVSVKGPSVTVRFSPEKVTRAPFELAWSPSAASSTPAFASSSLYFPIAARSFSSGRTPASESLLALTITMNRIVLSPSLTIEG